MRTRAYADSARMTLEDMVKDSPDNALLRMSLGLALAYMGRHGEAVDEGKRG